MEWIYLFVIKFYGLSIRILANFNEKAKAWVEGRKGWREKLSSALSNDHRQRIWFHCASLGEFEQGRPVLQQLRAEFPDHCIVLTFFSPSGYLNRKNEPLADVVTYLPLDGPVASKSFINLLNPAMVFFVKYEFWYFYGKELHKRKIPFFCISAMFKLAAGS